MNYEKIYNSLIERAKNRTLEGYKEIHHVIPRCLGGSDDPSNLAALTPEEHYLAHQLLIKIHPKNKKLIKAACMMIPNRPNNKMYGWLKRKFVILVTEDQTGEGNSQYGTVWIYNDYLRKSSKISANEDIPLGWNKGRKLYKKKKETVCKFVSKKTKIVPKLKKKISICNACIMDTNKKNAEMWHKNFIESKSASIRDYVRNSTYPHSHISFIKMLKTYVEEFKPEKGKPYHSQ